VIPAQFDYVEATSVADAIRLLAEHGDEAKLLAGGHSLIPLMKLRLVTPATLIDVTHIKELSYIKEDGNNIVIGALTRHRDIEESDLVKKHLPLVAHVAGEVGDPQVRNRGTIGGSLVQEMKLFQRKSSVVFDFYSTYFVNQLIVDRDQNVNAIVFRNLQGKSIANSFQVEWSIEPIKNFDVRFAYKNLDVKSTYGGIMQQQVMIPKHRFLFTTNYKTRNKSWKCSQTYY
jgi:hypothetical protein